MFIQTEWHVASRDIATKFAKLEHLRFMCSNGRYYFYHIPDFELTHRQCGNRIVLSTLEDPHVASYLHGTTLTSVSKNAKLFQVESLRN